MMNGRRYLKELKGDSKAAEAEEKVDQLTYMPKTISVII